MKAHPPTWATSLAAGTRASRLALAQTRIVIEGLLQCHEIHEDFVQIVPVQTSGDRIQDRPLADIGGKALWTRELDRALDDRRVDFAVHSMKDVESPIDARFILAAVLPRADVADVLIGAESLAAIASGATVGTSSPRRAAQLLHRRPDLRIASIRGNVETRMRKVAEGEFAATFLAAAGLQRLAIEAGVRLDPVQWTPAASQGAIGIVCRAQDRDLAAFLGLLDHAPTRQAILAERAFLDTVGGNCHSAIAAHGWFTDAGLHLAAELYSPDGSERQRAEAVAAAGESATALGARLAKELLARAGPAIRASLAA